MTTIDNIRIGVIGSGYISRHFYLAFNNKHGLRITRVLTRRNPEHCQDYPGQQILTNSLDEVIEHSDLIYECSGDPIYATDVIAKAMAAGKPIVTMNSEFHVTTGSFFVDKGLITEAEGDQPGSLAALHGRALEMGFKPLAYVNMKGFLNTNPKLEEMQYWAKKQGISLTNVTSFTDGTKIQIEQALVANGCDATFATQGMIGLNESNMDIISHELAKQAKRLNQAISDYIIYPGAPHGVFIIAEHDNEQHPMLRYVKMGDGPYYVLRQDAILLHLEVPRTIHNLLSTQKSLLNNSSRPKINVAAVSKRAIKKDELISKGIGGFDARGVGVHIKNNPDAVPIGLLQNARVKQNIEPNQLIKFDDLELQDSLALQAYKTVLDRVILE